MWTLTPDGAGGNNWSPVTFDLGSVIPPDKAYMATTADSAWMLRGSTGNPSQVTSGMLQFNMSPRTSTNISTETFSTNRGYVLDGKMVYVPVFGPKGILVALGGSVMGTTSYEPIGFTVVSVFDVASKVFWNQTTTGDIPDTLMDFCAAGLSSTNGTFEVYVDIAGQMV